MFKKLKALNLQRLAISGLFATGVASIVRGAWMIYHPAAFILGGLLLISLAVGFTIRPAK